MKDKQGFTLLELLIVIGIIAVLGGIMLAQFSSSTDSALAATCMNNMRTLCNAVMADGSKEAYYPSAGPYQYLGGDGKNKYWRSGWIGYIKDDSAKVDVSCYHDSGDDGEPQHHAITNGSIWRTIGGQQSAYVCPAHTKFCKQKKKPMPSWSYAMNSYFGWDCVIAADVESGRRSFGSGYVPFRYSSGTRKRPLEKVLLFAEIPYMENGVQHPEWSTAAGKENDAILQYPPASDEKKKANKASDGTGELIGFNHKTGKNYSAHVAFADGHCVKLVLPDGATEDNIKELTTWLCTGVEYTFNGSKYEKVSE